MPHDKHHDHHHHDKHATVVGPTGQADGTEYKYERVEKAEVDNAGHAHVVDVREDRGKEDPGMNYKDMRPPGLAPGQPIGVVPSAVSTTGTAPEIHSGIPGGFIADRTYGGDGRTLVQETTTVVGGTTGMAHHHHPGVLHSAAHVAGTYGTGDRVVTEKEKITEIRREF